MSDADELAEMRALQERAYGRDGELSDVDAVRLGELQARSAEAVDERAEAGGAEPVEASRVAPSTSSGTQVSESGEAPALGSGAWAAGRAPRWLVAAAAVAFLLCGVGVGWLLFGQSRAEAVALSAEQQEWQNALLTEGVYDSGSVRAVAAEEGVVVWAATRDERENTCIILSNGERTRPSCQATEVVEADGIVGSLLVEISEQSRREVMASLFFAPSGEAVVQMNSWEQTPGTANITYASEEETRIAAALAEDGFDPNSIWVAGYDGDVPVWSATELESQTPCLIYDGASSASPRVCADPQTMMDQESGLVLTVVDPLNGGSTTFEMSPNSGPQYLVITRQGGATGAGGD